jgi:hypothetical protein
MVISPAKHMTGGFLSEPSGLAGHRP